MFKKFQHKDLGRVAEQFSEHKCILLVNDTEGEDKFIIPILAIKDSEEREELIEKDWKEKARDEYELLQDRIETDIKEDFKEAIEKHAPKEKKFTREEVVKRRETTGAKSIEYVCNFLEAHNLLLD